MAGIHWRHDRVLRPFSELLASTLQAIRGMDEEDLKRLLAACHSVSTTNCWYVTYAAANTLRPWVESELRRRLARRKDIPPASRAPVTTAKMLALAVLGGDEAAADALADEWVESRASAR